MMLVSALGVSAVSRITSPSGELLLNVDIDADRSEERRVGKECPRWC